jgi:predicted enzyme related to lactoylglutathione lyase
VSPVVDVAGKAVHFEIAVDDIDTALAAIERAGGKRLTERMPMPEPAR